MAPELRLGTMGLYIIPLTVHTTPKLGTGQRRGPGNDGLHTHFPILGSGPGSVPVPVAGPMQCV